MAAQVPNLIGMKLYQKLLEGKYVDAYFKVGGEGVKSSFYGAHRVVMAIMSEYMERALESDFPKTYDEKGNIIISIPWNVPPESMRSFIKFLYTEELPGNGEAEKLVHMLLLGDRLLLTALYETCDSKIPNLITPSNCFQVWKQLCDHSATKSYEKAFEALLDNLGQVWDQLGVTQWTAQEWKSVLVSNYIKSATELDIFKRLHEWKEQNVKERQEGFIELLAYIRFPLMGADTITHTIAPLGVLDNTLLKELAAYFECPESNSTVFNATPRTVLTPSSSEELHAALEKARSGDTVELGGKIYAGNFKLSNDGVTLLGIENETELEGDDVLRPVLHVTASNCKILCNRLTSFWNSQRSVPVGVGYGMRIEGANNEMDNITIKGFHYGLEISGNDNEFAHSEIQGTKYCAIVNGQDNRLRSSRIGVYKFGIKVRGHRNSFKDIAFPIDPVNTIIQDSILQDLDRHDVVLHKDIIQVEFGNDHWFQNILYVKERLEDSDSFITIETPTSNCAFTDCQHGTISVKGQSHKFIDTKAEYLCLYTGGHTFSNCTARQVQYHHPDTRQCKTDQCNFEKSWPLYE